jgi:alpha-L-fucosidase
MNLRSNINILLLGAILFWVMSCGKNRETFYVQTVEIPAHYTHQQKVELSARVLPHPRQMKWFEDEFFGFIHYGPNTYTGREWGTGFEDAVIFNPTGLDTDQWCATMKAAGIRRVIMVVKHHEGYCLWPTRYTSHSVASSPWRDGKGDVLRELVASCEKYGLNLGIYLSPADLYQIESPGGYYGNRSLFTEREIPRKVEGRPFKDQRTFAYRVDDYNEYFLNQLFELLTEYGPIYEVWFDGANPKPGTGQIYTYDAWYDMIYELAPDAVTFGKGPDVRWCGNEGGRTRPDEYNVIPIPQSPETYDWPDKTEANIAGRDRITEDARFFHYYPAETNTSIRHGWFWRNDTEQQVRSADDVFDIYERSVGGNSVFHLNIPPNNEGRFSQRDVDVLLEVGRRIDQVYGNNLLSGAKASQRNVLDGKTDTWWDASSNNPVIEITLPEERMINRFVIREAIAHKGERVEEHHLEAWIDGEWKEVANGKTIGYKRILRFPPVKTSRLRLTITNSRLSPSIAHVSAHYSDEPPKAVTIARDMEGMMTMGVGTSFVWNNHGSIDQSQEIYYTLDGSDPGVNSMKYSEPFSLPMGGIVKVRSIVGNREGPINESRIGILKAGWMAFDGHGQSKEAMKSIDGNPRTRWLSDETSPSRPHSLTIDMQKEHIINGFTYIPNIAGGFIESFHVEISTDGKSWKKIHQDSFGNIRNDPSMRTVFFDTEHTARHIRFSNLKAPGDEKRVGAAEIDILAVKGANFQGSL